MVQLQIKENIKILCAGNPPPPPPPPPHTHTHTHTHTLPTKGCTTLAPKFGRHPLFADFERKKTPLFQPKSLLLMPNKTPLFKQNAIYFRNISYSTLFVKVRIYVTASKSRHFSLFVVFLITSKLWLNSNTLMHNNSNMRNKQMVRNKYMQNFTLFQNFADSCLQNDPLFLISRIRASH